jgi:ABC-type multidrug transport system fused ATPase/permease subunit
MPVACLRRTPLTCLSLRDPQGAKTDAELLSALQRSWLLPRDGAPPDPVADGKFSLDSKIGDEGSNYSAGEKQLLALCRALVKKSSIIVLVRRASSHLSLNSA